MKYLIMCEGNNELAIVNILLENDLLIYSEDDLLGANAYQARQLKTSAKVKNELNLYTGKDIAIIRIGDKQSDKITIPKEYKDQITGEIQKYCTKPELEILLIISEGLWSDFQKEKSTIGPKDFAKKNIKLNGRKYDNSSNFFKEYYSNCPQKLVNAIKVYKQKNGAHKKGELYLADLLK